MFETASRRPLAGRPADRGTGRYTIARRTMNQGPPQTPEVIAGIESRFGYQESLRTLRIPAPEEPRLIARGVSPWYASGQATKPQRGDRTAAPTGNAVN